MIDRRIIARPFRKPCQQSSFRQRQLFRRFAEIELRSCLEPEYAMPQRNLVRVQSKNLRLGEAPLDLDRKHRLLYLALPSPIGREKQVARQLHRQRGRALNLSRRLDIPVRSTDDPPEIDARMLVKILVFDGNESVSKHWREIVVTDNHAPLQRE